MKSGIGGLKMMAEGLAIIGIIYFAFFMGFGVIAILLSGLRILFELIKEWTK